MLESDDIRMIVEPNEVGPGQATAPGDRLVWHFVADTVNDFAWVTAKKLVWAVDARDDSGKGPVPINMYYQPGDAQLYADAGPRARHALEFYSKLWFPYSFPQLTMQDGPSAGMEYPMVINANQGAADHETFHQWAPMTVSNNETWYGWMDEGFNQYANILSGADSRTSPPNLDGLGQSYGRTSGNEAEPPMMWNANYGGPQFYSFMTYSKTPLMLSALGGVVGDYGGVARAVGVRQDVDVQASVAVGLHVLHEPRAQAGPRLVLVLLAVHHRQRRWLHSERDDVRQHDERDRATGWADAVAGRAQGRVRALGPGDQADGEREDGRQHDRDRDVAGRRMVPRREDVQGRSRLSARGRSSEIVFDPYCRFPDRDPSDNVWPRSTSAAPAPSGRGGRGGGAACGS